MSLGEIGRSVARLESKMDRWLEDHEQRLRSCEKWKNALPPTVLVALASAVVAISQAIWQ